MKLRTFLILGAAVLSAAATASAQAGNWVSMFNGKDLTGWEANQSPESWAAVDGTIKGAGPVSHLFWKGEECENCEFKAEVRIMDGSNSGMYFRTAFGPGFPKGYECQVNATHKDPVKTGSLYNFAKNLESPSKPGEWFTQHIIADGNHIVIKVNDKVITDYVDEKNSFTKGWLALQQHDPNSVVYYRNLMSRKLPAK